MSGIMMPLFGGAGGTNVAPDSYALDTEVPSHSGPASCGVTFKPDGTTTKADGSGAVAGKWYTPTTAGIGSQYWIVITGNGGGQATGTPISLASNVSLSWSLGTSSTTVANSSGSATVDFYSDAGATNHVASCGITFNLHIGS